MSADAAVPALVIAVEAVLETKVLALRYLPSPSAAGAALDDKTSQTRRLPGDAAKD